MIINTETHLIDDEALNRAAIAAGNLLDRKPASVAQHIIATYLRVLSERSAPSFPPFPLNHRTMAEVMAEERAAS